MFQDNILARHEGLIILPRIIISAVSGLRVITGYHPVSGVRRNNLTNDPVVPRASDARDPGLWTMMTHDVTMTRQLHNLDTIWLQCRIIYPDTLHNIHMGEGLTKWEAVSFIWTDSWGKNRSPCRGSVRVSRCCNGGGCSALL